MFELYPEAFRERFLGGVEQKVSEFWQAMIAAEHPALDEHPLVTKESFQTRAVPLSLHGDGVPVSGVGKAWSQSVDCYSFSSLLSSGSTIFSNYVIFFIYKMLKVSGGHRDTFAAFFRKLCWSFNSLFLGQWPLLDDQGLPFTPGSRAAAKAGQVLAGGFFGVLWCIRADLEFLANVLNLQKPTARQPCCLCLGDCTPQNAWTDFRDGGAWENTWWTRNADWHLHRQDEEVHPLLALPGLGVLAIYPDVMHVKHLGTDAYFYGSVLKYLTHHYLQQDTPENLERVWALVQHAYSANRTRHRYTNMRLSMFAGLPHHFPKLKGRAAEIRNLGRPLLHVVDELLDMTSLTNRQIRLGLKLSVRMEEIIDEHVDDIVWPQAVCQEFYKAAQSFLMLQTALGRHFHPQGCMLFHTTIKSHLLHVAQAARFMNPRLGWTYSGEDSCSLGWGTRGRWGGREGEGHREGGRAGREK